MIKVFLGGTCNETTWRNELIKKLHIDYYNPVVDDWTSDCIDIEEQQKQICDYCLFVLTKEMTGVYSIAEVVDLSNKRPDSTLLCVLYDGFNKGQKRSLNAVERLVKNNGSHIFDNLQGIADFLNIKEGEDK